MAPTLASSSREIPKETALELAVVLGGTIAEIPAQAAAARQLLDDAARTLLTSVAARARDAHGPNLLLDALVAMDQLGLRERTLVDIFLSALFTWTCRAPLD